MYAWVLHNLTGSLGGCYQMFSLYFQWMEVTANKSKKISDWQEFRRTLSSSIDAQDITMGCFVWHEPSSFGTSVPENVCRLWLTSREASAHMHCVASSLVFGKRGLVLPEELDALTAKTCVQGKSTLHLGILLFLLRDLSGAEAIR